MQVVDFAPLPELPNSTLYTERNLKLGESMLTSMYSTQREVLKWVQIALHLLTKATCVELKKF